MEFRPPLVKPEGVRSSIGSELMIIAGRDRRPLSLTREASSVTQPSKYSHQNAARPPIRQPKPYRRTCNIPCMTNTCITNTIATSVIGIPKARGAARYPGSPVHPL